MLILNVMNERIKEFLSAENKSSAQLAEEIGVQPSGISHILSGRNNPSLDFILKMLEKYQFLSTDWLLFGKGKMYKDNKMQSLFEDEADMNTNNTAKTIQIDTERAELETKESAEKSPGMDSLVNDRNNQRSVSRIVMFYDDNSFEQYFPNH